MIEWVPIKEFLDQNQAEDEIFLVLRKNSRTPVMTSILSFHRDEFLERYTHAAKINLPKETTIDEKIETFYADNVFGKPLSILSEPERLEIKTLIGLVKDHYEGEK